MPKAGSIYYALVFVVLLLSLSGGLESAGLSETLHSPEHRVLYGTSTGMVLYSAEGQGSLSHGFTCNAPATVWYCTSICKLRPFLMICMVYKPHFCDLYVYISFNTTCMHCVFLTLTWIGAMQHTKYICTCRVPWQRLY